MNRVGGGDVPASIFRDFVQRASAQMAKGRRRPSAVKAEPQSAEPAPAASAPAPAAPGSGPEARGVPDVIDTGTLSFRGRTVRLAGVDGQGGHLARQLARYLRRREVVCAPDSSGSQGTRCRIDGDDLAALILSAGGARASEDAPPDLLAAEEQARSERTGMWGGRR